MYGHDDRTERAYGGGGFRGKPAGGAVHGTVRLFVHNLSYRTSWQDLKDHARQAGEVVHTKVNLDQTGRSKGNGFIEFATRGEALEAIKLLDETELDGRVITVREDREEPAFAEGGARGGGEGCFLCGQPGHLKRDCPQSGGGGGPFKSATDSAQTCHNCGGVGHVKRDCPSQAGALRMPDRGRAMPAAGNAPGEGNCNLCGKAGHWKRECPTAGGRGAGGGRGRGGRGPAPDADMLESDLEAYFASRTA